MTQTPGEILVEAEAVKIALGAVNLNVPLADIIAWPRWQRSNALGWALYNADVIMGREHEPRAPLDYMLPYLALEEPSDE